MTTYSISFKKEKSKLEFTKAKIISKNLYLLSNPEDDNEIKIKKSCKDKNIFNLINLIDFNISTFIPIEK